MKIQLKYRFKKFVSETYNSNNKMIIKYFGIYT